MGVGPSAQSLCVSSCLKLRQFSSPSRQFYMFLWVIFPHDHSELRLVSAMPELASNGMALNSFVIILLFAALIAGFCFAISRLSYSFFSFRCHRWCHCAGNSRYIPHCHCVHLAMTVNQMRVMNVWRRGWAQAVGRKKRIFKQWFDASRWLYWEILNCIYTISNGWPKKVWLRRRINM